MKVYVVTSGIYSEYHIVRVFLDREEAEKYCNVRCDMEIEEFDTEAEMDKKPDFLYVQYTPEENEICIIGDWCECTLTDEEIEETESKTNFFCANRTHVLQFYTRLTDRLASDMEKYGNNSPLLLKIAQDRYAKAKAEKACIT